MKQILLTALLAITAIVTAHAQFFFTADDAQYFMKNQVSTTNHFLPKEESFGRTWTKMTFNGQLLTRYFTMDEQSLESFKKSSTSNDAEGAVANLLNPDSLTQLAFLNNDAMFFWGFSQENNKFAQSKDLLDMKFRSVIYDAKGKKTLMDYTFTNQDIEMLDRMHDNGVKIEDMGLAFVQRYGFLRGLVYSNTLTSNIYGADGINTDITVEGNNVVMNAVVDEDVLKNLKIHGAKYTWLRQMLRAYQQKGIAKEWVDSFYNYGLNWVYRFYLDRNSSPNLEYFFFPIDIKEIAIDMEIE